MTEGDKKEPGDSASNNSADEISPVIAEIVELKKRIAAEKNPHRKSILNKILSERLIFEKYDRSIPDELRKLREEILKLHSNIPGMIVRKYFPRGYKNPALYEDLVQFGNIGIMLAADKYDPSHKSASSFFNYASIWALKLIYEGLEGDRTVRLPPHVASTLSKQYRNLLEAQKKGYYTIEEWKSLCEESSQKYIEVSSDMAKNIPLWGDTIKYSDDENEPGVYIDAIISHDSNCEYVENNSVAKGLLKEFLDRGQNRRNLEIFSDFCAGGMSMRAIALKHGVHHAQVSNVVFGKKDSSGVIKTRPFVERAKIFIQRGLDKKGLDLKSVPLDDLMTMFLDIVSVKGSDKPD